MALDEDFTYFNGINFKALTNITDALSDAEINLLGHSADAQIDTDIFPFADSLPLDNINLRAAQSAALYYALSTWYAEQNNQEKATFYDTQYTKEITNLEQKLAAEHTGRTKRVTASLTYDTESELFSQTLR
jgi:hypothetical protein